MEKIKEGEFVGFRQTMSRQEIIEISRSPEKMEEEVHMSAFGVTVQLVFLAPDGGWTTFEFHPREYDSVEMRELLREKFDAQMIVVGVVRVYFSELNESAWCHSALWKVPEPEFEDDAFLVESMMFSIDPLREAEAEKAIEAAENQAYAAMDKRFERIGIQ
jgi:hypothetical protein